MIFVRDQSYKIRINWQKLYIYNRQRSSYQVDWNDQQKVS